MWWLILATAQAEQPPELHYSELEVTKRVNPTYPAAAKTLGLPSQRCLARVSIATDGLATGVDIDPDWRWVPARETDDPVEAAVTMTFVRP